MENSIQRSVTGDFDDVVDTTVAALEDEGFGVLCDVDIQATLEQKLGEEFHQYRVLGACNPRLAEGLTEEIELGALLPTPLCERAFESKRRSSLSSRSRIVMGLRSNTVVYHVAEVVVFTQETCGACAAQREKNDGREEKYPDVEFREIDIRADLETADEYGVRKTPTTLVSANGKETAEFIGIVERNDLESAIERATEQSSGLVQRLVDVVGK